MHKLLKHTISLRLRTTALAPFWLVSVLTPAVYAQNPSLTFDWSTRPKDLGQSVSAPTLQLSSAQTVTFVINNVNDIFYRYSMNCTGTEKPSSWPEELNGLLRRTGVESASKSCEDGAQSELNKIDKYRQKIQSCSENCPSESLADTRTQFREFIGEIDQLLSSPACNLSDQTELGKKLRAVRGSLQSAKDAVHEVVFKSSISPDLDYSCVITEYLNRQPTKDGTMTISVKPKNVIVTLSLGQLFSGISNRRYSAVTVPNADSSATANVLGVEGNSFSTSIAALANFRLPIRKVYGDDWGLDATAGPVFRLNSQNSVSSVGFFAGISLRLYRYLFVTPGFHIGQFADFPQGFRSIGQPIPPNFPTPQSVNRTTARFGIAISFQTKDFKSLGSSSVTATPPPAAKTETNQAASPGPAPEIQAENPLSVKINPVNFGKIGDSLILRSLTIKNDGKVAFAVAFDEARLTDAIEIQDPAPCDRVPAGRDCTVTLKTKPSITGKTSPIMLPVTVVTEGQNPARKTLEVTLTWEK